MATYIGTNGTDEMDDGAATSRDYFDGLGGADILHINSGVTDAFEGGAGVDWFIIDSTTLDEWSVIIDFDIVNHEIIDFWR